MTPIMLSFLLLAVVSCFSAAETNSPGVLQLQIEGYYNRYGRDNKGRCCALSANSTAAVSSCPAQCRTFFRVCAAKVGPNWPEEPDLRQHTLACPLGLLVTPSLARNSLDPQKDGLLLMRFPYKEWPGKLKLTLEAWHDVTGDLFTSGNQEMTRKDNPEENVARLILRVERRHRLTLGEDWLRRSVHLSVPRGETKSTRKPGRRISITYALRLVSAPRTTPTTTTPVPGHSETVALVSGYSKASSSVTWITSTSTTPIPRPEPEPELKPEPMPVSGPDPTTFENEQIPWPQFSGYAKSNLTGILTTNTNMPLISTVLVTEMTTTEPVISQNDTEASSTTTTTTTTIAETTTIITTTTGEPTADMEIISDKMMTNLTEPHTTNPSVVESYNDDIDEEDIWDESDVEPPSLENLSSPDIITELLKENDSNETPSQNVNSEEIKQHVSSVQTDENKNEILFIKANERTIVKDVNHTEPVVISQQVPKDQRKSSSKRFKSRLLW